MLTCPILTSLQEPVWKLTSSRASESIRGLSDIHSCHQTSPRLTPCYRCARLDAGQAACTLETPRYGAGPSAAFEAWRDSGSIWQICADYKTYGLSHRNQLHSPLR